MSTPKLRVGLVFEGKLEIGGGFQQALSTLLALHDRDRFHFVPIVFLKQNQETLTKLGVKSTLCKRTLYSKIKEKIMHYTSLKYFVHFFRISSALEKTLTTEKIDICYFLTPSSQAVNLRNHHFIMTVWDLSHRDFVEFPEVNFKHEFDRRELLYQSTINKAVAVIVDSEYGKQNLISYYNASPHRIHACHFTPSINIAHTKDIDIKAKYGIDGDYIYYPAQFWAHKNHIYILEALKILKEQNIIIYAIFSGSNQGNLAYILQSIIDFELENQVHYIGFAPNDEIAALYQQSLALVMPTYFGPTNIPPLEAFSLGVPVIYSNLPDLCEQVGNAALMCDLKDPHSLAGHLKDLLQNQALREHLALKGRERLKELNYHTIAEVLCLVLDDFAIKRKCWQPNP